MKVLLSTDKLERGGKEKQLMLLASGLLKRNYDVQILSKDSVHPENFFHEIGFPEERIHSFGDGPGYYMRKRFKRKVMELHPDIILNFDIRTSLWTEHFSRALKRFPAVNCTIRRSTPYPSKKSNLLAKLCLRKSKYIVAVSEAGLNHYNIQKSKDHVVIHCGIHIANYKNATPVTFKEIFGIEKPQNAFVIANVANLHEHKGQHTLIEALGQLNNDKVYAIILGEGPLHESLQSHIDRLNLTDRVLLLGRQSNVAEFLKSADVYINTSWGEGFSNGLLEAMVSGLPIITTPDGGIPEVADPNNTIYFDKNNADQLQERLTSALNKTVLKPAEEEWIKQFDVNIMVDKFEALIQRIAVN